MPDNGTTSVEIPGWYIQFQTDILLHLPRLNEISEEVALGWHDNRGAMKQALLSTLVPPKDAMIVAKKFPTWKTVKLRTHKSMKDLSKALTNDGSRISDWAMEILGKATLATERKIDLVKVSVSELGFEKSATRAEICDRAEKYGLVLVPAEVAAQLRRQYTDQPYGEWLLIGMRPVTVSGHQSILRVAHDGDARHLDTVSGDPDSVWRPGFRFVFARRKQS